jgi:hypothetical protein
MLSIALHRKSSGHNVEKQGGSRHSTKKRKQEEMEENVQVGVAATMRSKKSPTHGSKHLERLSQHFPGTSPDTTLGAPERHSLNLASLVATIRWGTGNYFLSISELLWDVGIWLRPTFDSFCFLILQGCICSWGTIDWTFEQCIKGKLFDVLFFLVL